MPKLALSVYAGEGLEARDGFVTLLCLYASAEEGVSGGILATSCMCAVVESNRSLPAGVRRKCVVCDVGGGLCPCEASVPCRAVFAATIRESVAFVVFAWGCPFVVKDFARV